MPVCALLQAAECYGKDLLFASVWFHAACVWLQACNIYSVLQTTAEHHVELNREWLLNSIQFQNKAGNRMQGIQIQIIK